MACRETKRETGATLLHTIHTYLFSSKLFYSSLSLLEYILGTRHGARHGTLREVCNGLRRHAVARRGVSWTAVVVRGSRAWASRHATARHDTPPLARCLRRAMAC